MKDGTGTTMILLEFPDMSAGWECEKCGDLFLETDGFLEKTHCPNCGARIIEWEEAE